MDEIWYGSAFAAVGFIISKYADKVRKFLAQTLRMQNSFDDAPRTVMQTTLESCRSLQFPNGWSMFTMTTVYRSKQGTEKHTAVSPENPEKI